MMEQLGINHSFVMKQSPMHISLIGASNVGKTHWAQRLEAECGFKRIDCDLLVEQKIGPELTNLGYSGIRDVAKWMGQPYDPQYSKTSDTFIACERAVMLEIINELKITSPEVSVVVDTTGSVIYCGDDIIEQLRALTQVIYLDASAEHFAQLFDSYIAEPKPVIWGDAFNAVITETPLDSLKRCYPKLLEFRARRYREMSHTIISFSRHREMNAEIQFLVPA